MRIASSVALILALVLTPGAEMLGQKGDKAPAFSLKDGAGQTVDIRKLEGKVVVVNFWATWCAPCVKEIPGFVSVYNKYKPKGLEIVGVSLDRDGWTKVRPFQEKMKIPYPLVIGTGELANSYGATRYIPTTVVVDRKGVVQVLHEGYMSESDFEGLVKKYL